MYWRSVSTNTWFMGKLDFLVILLYIVLQGVSVALGWDYYNRTKDLDIDLILTTFICVPTIAVSFSAFYGIWVSNDYSAYEYSYTKAKNFKIEEIAAFNKLSSW